jgi:hypothetical protein
MGAFEVLQALSDPARLRLLVRIADAGEDGCALKDAARDPRAARKQVARLSAAGLVEPRGSVFVARLERIREAVDELADTQPRWVDIPRAPERRLAFLRDVAERFEPGRDYSEPEVNTTLREVNDDHVALRRYMVDAGLLVRDDAGTAYRRA